MRAKNLLVLLLSAILLSSSLVACAKDDTNLPEDTTTAPDTTSEQITETTADPLADNLPDDLDFGGETFSAYTRTRYFFHGEMFMEEDSEDQLNAARYAAKVAVQNRLNVTLNEVYYDNNDAPRNLLMSGDDTYEMVNGRHVIVYNYAAEGLAREISDLPYVDFSAAWWDKDFSDNLTVGSNRYFAAGAYNLTTYDSVHMLLFNKEVYNDLKIEENHLGGKSIYEIVKEGKWTLDLFTETMTDVSSDLDGDGEMTDADRYGYIAEAKQILPSFLLGANQYMLQKDSDNLLFNNMEGNEQFYNTFSKILDVMYENNNWLHTKAGTSDADALALHEVFKENRGLYRDTTGGNIENYRSMDTDFGILPYPKADESQESYRARSEYPEFFVIPLVNNRLDLTGAVLEAFSNECYRTVIPTYYEVSLQSRTARDSASADMLDIIYSNRVFDFGDTVFCDEIRDGKLRYLMADQNYDLTSALASISGKVTERLDKMNDGFRE